MILFMENRVYPDNCILQLYKAEDKKQRDPQRFLLKECIGTGASCVAYKAEGNDGIPVKLKQFRPAGIAKGSSLYRMAEERFVEAYRQQISMMRDEKTASVTSGLHGLYRDDAGYYWTSVSCMVGQTLDKLLPENSFQKNLEILHRIAECIKAYHEAGWLLLDIKPENILVIDSLGIQGINFFDFDSFVRMEELEKAAAEGRTMMLSSSEAYSAPELLEAEVDLQEIGITADFYSIGAILFTAVFNRKPELFDCMPDCEYEFSEGAEKNLYNKNTQLAIVKLLHHTLTLSSFGRYETDDELLNALDALIKEASATRPQLIRFVPGPSESFTGRQRELDALTNSLRNSHAPIYISGISGIGKTQLALRAAEMLREEFRFYFTNFKGNVRKTILSLPFDNLPRERKDENGVLIPIPDDELYAEILSTLRRDYTEKDILIIDNFDAPSDEDTPALRYDRDLAELESLPMRLVFTSRCRFENAHTIEIGNLDDDSLLQLLRSAFPDDSEEALIALLDAVGRHTLTVSLLTRSAKESKGMLTIDKLLQQLSHSKQNSVFSHLQTIFNVSEMSKTAKSVMACASLFPQKGISSDLLMHLFSPQQWVTANQLERSGWLTFDSSRCVWSVHPLIRAVCASSPSTQPDWDNAGEFVTALKNAEARGDFSSVSTEDRYQLDELFSAIGKLSLKKKLPWKPAAAVFALLAAIAAGLIFYLRPVDTSPVLTLELFPAEEATEEMRKHEAAVLSDRLNAYNIKDYSLDEGSDVFTVNTHTSVFGNIEDLKSTIHATLNRKGIFYAVGKGGFMAEYCDISREHILSAKASVGTEPGISREIRSENDIALSGDYPYLTVQFDEEAQRIIKSLETDWETITFGFDMEMDDSISFALCVPGNEKGFYYLMDGRWKDLPAYQALANLMKQEPLESNYTFRTELFPAAVWQDPADLSDDARGIYQRAVKDLNGETVTFFYNSSNAKEISDFSYAEVFSSFKDRLDLLQVEYAIGTEYFDNRSIAVCMPAAYTSFDVISSVLPASSINISSSYYHEELHFGNEYDYTAEIIQKPDGFYALALNAKDEYSESGAEKLLRLSSSMLAEDDNLITLQGRTSIEILASEIPAPIQDGRLIFDQIPFLSISQIDEEQLPLLQLLCHIINTNGRLASAGVYYRFNDEYRFSASEADFGIQRKLLYGADVIEKLNSDYPGVTARRSDTQDHERIFVFLHKDLSSASIQDSADLIEKIYYDCDIYNSNLDGLIFILTNEEGYERCRVLLNKSSSFDSSTDRYATYAVAQGEKILSVADELDQVFSSREFYKNRSFYTQIIRKE